MSLPSVNDVTTTKGLGQLNGYLSSRSYIEGYAPSTADATYAKAVGSCDLAKFKHVNRFVLHVSQFSMVEQAAWVGAAPAKKAEESEDDLFGDSDSEEEEVDAKAAAAERAAKAKAAKEAAAAKKKKAAPVGRSQIVFDIKVWEADTDLDMLAAKIKSEVNMDGLTWTEAVSKVPLAFGIFKLQVMCIVVDDLVPSTDFIAEPIEAMEDLVQSVDIFAFNKV